MSTFPLTVNKPEIISYYGGNLFSKISPFIIPAGIKDFFKPESLHHSLSIGNKQRRLRLRLRCQNCR